MSKVNIDETTIKTILPHRSPFLFVESVIELTPGEKILAKRTLKKDESHFAGHFPSRPIMPGVLIAEALAQTSGLLLALTAKDRGEKPEGKIFYLAKADMKWINPAHPGDVLYLEARTDRALGPFESFKVKAYTRRKDVASGKLTLAKVEG